MTVPCATTLIEMIQRSQLLKAAQLEELVGVSRNEDVRSLAREIVGRHWLTTFQVNQLLAGRGADLIIGPYLLLQRLGEGGTGQVFKARHQRMDRLVALKLIRRELLTDAEVVNRFLREIQVLSQMSHPNVVHAYDAGPVGSTYFLAMEHVEGIDLFRLVKQSGVLPVEKACTYIRQGALALQHAHERGLVHRDVKPPNFLVTQAADAQGTGVVKLLDLGLARLHRPVDSEKTAMLTPAGQVMFGTPDYLAPEQAVNFHDADIRADIYSLGCTLFYLLTGRPPFEGGTLAQKLLRHQQSPPPALERLCADVPANVAALVRHMLAKDPRERFQTPAEVVAVLDGGPLPVAITTLKNDDRTLLSTSEAISAKKRPTRVTAAAPRLQTRQLELDRSISKRATGAWLLWSAAAVCPLGVAGIMAYAFLPWSGTEIPAAKSESQAQQRPQTQARPQTQPIVTASGPASELSRLLARWDAPGSDREQLRSALLGLRQTYPGTSESRQAARLLRQLPSPLDRLDAKTIDPGRRPGWPAAELVAFFGEQRKAGPGAHGHVTFAPDGLSLAAIGDGGSVRLWDLQTGKVRAVLPTRRKDARAVFTPDGQTMVIYGGSEPGIALWDLTAQQPQERNGIAGHTSPVRALAISADGKLLASVAADGTIRLSDLSQPGAPECGRINRPTDRIGAMACSPDGNLLASFGSDGTIRIWELDQRPAKLRYTLTGPAGDSLTMAFSPDGDALTAAGSTTLMWFDVRGSSPRKIWEHSFGRAMSMAVAPDGQSLAATVGNGRLFLFEATGIHRPILQLPVTTQSIDFAPDGRYIAVACPGDCVAILCVGKPLKK